MELTLTKESSIVSLELVFRYRLERKWINIYLLNDTCSGFMFGALTWVPGQFSVLWWIHKRHFHNLVWTLWQHDVFRSVVGRQIGAHWMVVNDLPSSTSVPQRLTSEICFWCYTIVSTGWLILNQLASVSHTSCLTLFLSVVHIAIITRLNWQLIHNTQLSH